MWTGIRGSMCLSSQYSKFLLESFAPSAAATFTFSIGSYIYAFNYILYERKWCIRMEKADILDNVRKSLEITLTFFTVILVSILFFVVGASSHAVLAMNQNATPYQAALSEYHLQNLFWNNFFNSYGFLLLISGIIYAWLFIVISYLVNSRTKTFYLVWCAIIVTAFGFVGAIMTLHTYANYYSSSFVLLISIAVLIWLIFTIKKVIEAAKPRVSREIQDNYK